MSVEHIVERCADGKRVEHYDRLTLRHCLFDLHHSVALGLLCGVLLKVCHMNNNSVLLCAHAKLVEKEHTHLVVCTVQDEHVSEGSYVRVFIV